MRTSTSKSSIAYAILSNTIVLVLIGLFALLYFHTNAITNLVREKINILVEIKPGVSKTKIDELSKKISAQPEVLAGSVKFVSKEEAGFLLEEAMRFDTSQVALAFKDIISFNVAASSYTEANLKRIKESIKRSDSVHDVFYENVVVENIKSNLNKLSFGVLILSLIFVFLAVVIIYNTINLSLYADRWEIKTMEIIGARDSFIRQPYLKIAGKIAITSFMIATLLILLVLTLIYLNFEGIKEIIKYLYLFLSIAIIFVISLFITLFATVTIVNKYLYKHESELY